jgi:hypothetical protein
MTAVLAFAAGLVAALRRLAFRTRAAILTAVAAAALAAGTAATTTAALAAVPLVTFTALALRTRGRGGFLGLATKDTLQPADESAGFPGGLGAGSSLLVGLRLTGLELPVIAAWFAGLEATTLAGLPWLARLELPAFPAIARRLETPPLVLARRLGGRTG